MFLMFANNHSINMSSVSSFYIATISHETKDNDIIIEYIIIFETDKGKYKVTGIHRPISKSYILDIYSRIIRCIENKHDIIKITDAVMSSLTTNEIMSLTVDDHKFNNERVLSDSYIPYNTIPELVKKDIYTLLDYLYKDEKKDFEEKYVDENGNISDTNNDKNNHIFTTISRLTEYFNYR